MVCVFVGFPRDVREMLEPGERVLWAGKPARKPFVLKTLPVVVLLLPFLAAPLLIFAVAGDAFFHPFVLLFFVFWYGVLGVAALSPLYSFLVWKNVFYVVTDRRVIVRRGLVGIDYDVLELVNVQQVNVDVGIWDKMCGTGTITLQSVGVSPLRLENVEEPRRVQKIIMRAAAALRESELKS
ncbi:MAG TPA: PH domain-containing protein [Thermofilum sp.]|nr:PH domain-containing protein [Thermofilum sp.]